jgi:hypothetical protein
MFESLKIRIWILPFDLAQGGELVEPFVICELVLGIFSIKELVWIKIYHKTFITFLWDMTLGIGTATAPKRSEMLSAWADMHNWGTIY